MSDLAIIVTADGTLDLDVCCNDLVVTDGLESAVAVCLFTDVRAPADADLPAGADRGGCWMDSFPDIDGDAMGSLIWLLKREKQTEPVRQRAERYAVAALQCLIDDGVAASITVACSYPERGILAWAIEVIDKRGSRQRFAFAVDQSGAMCKCPTVWPYEPTPPGGRVNPDFIVGT